MSSPPPSPSPPLPELPPLQILASSSQLERAASELKLLQQEALADQAAIRLLLERESAGMASAAAPADWAMVSAALGMALALLFAWGMLRRYAGHGAHPDDGAEAPQTVMPSLPSASEFEQFLDQDTTFTPKDAQLPESEADEADDGRIWAARTSVADTRSGQFQRVDTAQASFDSEAAASDVMRVRQSLAQKRMARMREYEAASNKKAALDIDLGQQDETPDEAVDARVPQPDEFLDSLPPEHWQLDDADGKKESAPPPPPQVIDETISFSLPAKPAPKPKPEPAPVPATAPVVLESPQAPAENPYAIDLDSEGPQERDYSITLTLAYESESLESWSAARILASEVLESGDPDLMQQARRLLGRLARHETVEVHEEPPWDDSL